MRSGENAKKHGKTPLSVSEMEGEMQTLAEAQPGDLVAIGGTWNNPYWPGTVLEINPGKKLLRVLSKRFEHRASFPGCWYNHEGKYTNAQGKVLKRIPWGIGTIEPLTKQIEQ